MTEAEYFTPKPGMRVGVFYGCSDSTLLLLGYGVYEGDEIPPEDILAAEIGPPALIQLAVPKLRLDDGTVVWGCECWWNHEDLVKGLAQDRQIIYPKLASVREKAKAAWDKANKTAEEEEERLP